MANIYGVQFDEVNDYFSLDDNAAWDIIQTNGDQFYAFWMEVDDNTGSFFQYFFSNGGFGGANTINAFLNEASAASLQNQFQARPTSSGQVVMTSAITVPTGKFLLILQYNSTSGDLEYVICDEAGTATRTIAAAALTNDILSSVWELGRRTDGNSDRYFGSIIYNLAKGDTYLSNAQVENLASDFLNYEPTDEFTPAIYFPMNEGSGSDITDDILSLTGTGVGFTGSQWILAGQSGGGVTVTATLGTIDYTSQNATVALTGSVDIVTTLGTISYSSQNATIGLTGDIDVTATLGTIDYSSNNTTVSIDAGTIVNATLGTIDYTSQNTTVVLSGLVDVTATLGAIVYNSYPAIVQIGEGQTIGNVTVGFADDIYTAGFKPDTITVSFK